MPPIATNGLVVSDRARRTPLSPTTGSGFNLLEVANTGDRPIQVGSHYHFYETNAALTFDREKTRGFRLDIAAGTAVRFEPGQERDVELVKYRGEQRVYGFRGLVMGKL